MKRFKKDSAKTDEKLVLWCDEDEIFLERIVGQRYQTTSDENYAMDLSEVDKKWLDEIHTGIQNQTRMPWRTKTLMSMSWNIETKNKVLGKPAGLSKEQIDGIVRMILIAWLVLSILSCVANVLFAVVLST